MVLATALAPTQAAITIRKPACPFVFIACHLIGTTIDAAVRVGRAICQILIGQVQMKKIIFRESMDRILAQGLGRFCAAFLLRLFQKLESART